MNDDRPESFKAEINAIPHSFSKITWGTANLKKIEKVYSTFQISSSESIVAYIKSSIPFMGPSIVITDHTLYSYLHEAFSISEICRYVVSQADQKAAVTLSTAGETHNFLGSTLVAKNIAGAELVQLIRNLQQELLKKYTWAKQLRDAMASELLVVAQGGVFRRSTYRYLMRLPWEKRIVTLLPC